MINGKTLTATTLTITTITQAPLTLTATTLAGTSRSTEDGLDAEAMLEQLPDLGTDEVSELLTQMLKEQN